MRLHLEFVAAILSRGKGRDIVSPAPGAPEIPGWKHSRRPCARQAGVSLLHTAVNEPYLNWNMSNRSPRAGLFVGTYGLSGVDTGFGKLSRLRVVNGVTCQFLSMNFRIDTWSV
jgi:hypothetical protein